MCVCVCICVCACVRVCVRVCTLYQSPGCIIIVYIIGKWKKNGSLEIGPVETGLTGLAAILSFTFHSANIYNTCNFDVLTKTDHKFFYSFILIGSEPTHCTCNKKPETTSLYVNRCDCEEILSSEISCCYPSEYLQACRSWGTYSCSRCFLRLHSPSPICQLLFNPTWV